ncbi:MAG: hypothetical protein MJ075_06125 [Oscillospiraceae bacterium]|nr:hypothetical protein [Oscillospiraceae bacterium]
MKKVRAVDDIEFELAPEYNIAKGTEFGIGGVQDDGVILIAANGDRFLLDTDTFEAGFEISEL